MSDWPATWTTALSEIIAKGWSANLAAAELSAQFNRRFTRSAVIGKAKRAGIKLTAGHGGRRGPKGGPSQRKVRPRATSAPRPDMAHRKAAGAPKLATVPFVLRPDDVKPNRVSLLELTDQTCRWPISTPGAPDFCFCGNPPVEGLPYCGGHSRLAYRPPEPRRQHR